ncbi:3-keto-5-aminohexanoate cleavage protein [Sulfoacidibacillus thermotolerans]|uniref:3-keto-5-aminohexanoate cleavage protein n=1 Tax=Sulfoacidibacillus thermotolerans TaxID=1765684 RepID=A0A2U3D9L2_SULT2|nr:3-keto-5-aminohexanoate cleavage protein [Sulfoacidibacillus thermotolerans]PWI57955.1 3-keto-5-aminohexanoate cleavage protein [Sulfoacidibacillus thermotolerans]
MQKLVITAAVNGAEVMREQTPYVPITPEEIASAAVEAAAAGASIVHVHARRPDGSPTQDKAVYREIIERIREQSSVIVQVSTGGAVGMTADERGDVISLAPEMATLSTGTVNFGEGVFYNSPDLIADFAARMKKYGVRPEIEVFDIGMIANAQNLVKKGLLSEPLHFDLVLGVPGAIPGEIAHLMHMIATLPQGSTWTAAGVGRAQLPITTAAILLGGHVRVGLEDNIYYTKGRLAESSAQLVARVVRIAQELGRELATPDEARQIVGISSRA